MKSPAEITFPENNNPFLFENAVFDLSALDDDSLNGPVPSMGRITGSASIETLVRVGIEKENGLGPESKMVVLHDFTPCVDDELEVKRGQIVNVLYQENDWVYVISENNLEGFIPHSYCAQYGSQLAGLALNVKKKLPRDPNQQQGTTVLPPPASSNGSANSANGGATVAAPASSSTVSGVGNKVQQQQRFGSHPPIPDVLNPANAMIHKNENDPNMTMITTVTNVSSMGRVNAGMEQSDTDSFQNHFQSNPRVTSVGQHHLQQTDPSRSNSLMSETSSQPDIHPFFKVQPISILTVKELCDERALSIHFRIHRGDTSFYTLTRLKMRTI